MATLLENGGTVQLWGGWVIKLPPAYHERNADGSWSAWGADWTIDAIIMEVAGKENGEPATAEDMLREQRNVNLIGPGWVGCSRLLQEADNGRDVYRLTANLAAVNTCFSVWISYFDADQQLFVEQILRNVAHSGN